jgi:hypothetical protein
MTKPCSQCPFLKSMAHGFTLKRLKEFASGVFPCHKTAEPDEGGYHATADSVHCDGALIFNEKRGTANQMMRISERLGLYDHTKLDMTADVR